MGSSKSKSSSVHDRVVGWFSALPADRKFFAVAGAGFFAALVVSSSKIAFDSHFVIGFAKNFVFNPLWAVFFQIVPALLIGVCATRDIKNLLLRWAVGVAMVLFIFVVAGTFITSVILDSGSLQREAKIGVHKNCNYSAETSKCLLALEEHYGDTKDYTCLPADGSSKDGWRCLLKGETKKTPLPAVCRVSDRTKACMKSFHFLLYRNLAQKQQKSASGLPLPRKKPE